MPEYKLPVPKPSQDAFWAHKEKSPQNASLVFDRFIPDTTDDSKIKEKGLASVLFAFGKADGKLLEEWNRRWEATIESAGARDFELKTDWRLIAGLGRKGALEVGFTFHRYGFPYLLGSSLKGLARAYALLEIAAGLDESRKKEGVLKDLETALSQEKLEDFEKGMKALGVESGSESFDQVGAFRFIFGTTDTAGKAIFFDAIPHAMPHLEVDIMNPHYPEYYKEGSSEFPTNWQSPVPVKFLTVGAGCAFRFAIGWRRSPSDRVDASEQKQSEPWIWFKGEKSNKQPAPEDHPRMLKLARRWLKGGLLDLGVGGKTSAGYGYFDK